MMMFSMAVPSCKKLPAGSQVYRQLKAVSAFPIQETGVRFRTDSGPIKSLERCQLNIVFHI